MQSNLEATSRNIELDLNVVSSGAWNQLITRFEDASLYQTYSFGKTARGAQNLEHIVLRSGDDVVGCCQVMLRKFGVFATGIADIKCGPLWRRGGSSMDLAVYRQLLSVLKQHYGSKRGFYIRIWPHDVGINRENVKVELESEGFTRNPDFQPFRTLILDLSPSIDDLRKNLLQKWRNCLNKAEKSDLQVLEDSSKESFQAFLAMAEAMMKRKGFVPGADYHLYGKVNSDLPGHLKLRILRCESAGETIAIAIYTHIGDTGTYLLGATSERGMGLNGAYLLQWKMISNLKERGAKFYDLGGIDPVGNPGVYQFKLGAAGKTGSEVTYLGQYDGCFGPRARIGRAVFFRGRQLARLLRRNA